MVRVLHVLNRDTPASTLRQLALLRGSLAQEFETQVCSLENDSRRRHGISNICEHVIFCRPPHPCDATFIYRFIRLLRQCDPDIVHLWDHSMTAWATLANRFSGDRPLIAHLWRDEDIAAYRQAGRWLRSASHAVVPSERQKHELLHSGCAAKQITVIVPGVGRGTGDQANSLRMEFDLSPKATLVAAAGELSADARFKDLIWSLDLLRVIHPEAHLFIAGEGEGERRLSNFAATIGLGHCVHFLNNRHDMDGLLAQCFCYWHASERDTNSILQAMALGLPVVAADVPAHRSAIIDGKTGRFVTLGDCAAVARTTNLLLRDPETANQMGKSGRERAETYFAAPRMAREFEALYRRVVRPARAAWQPAKTRPTSSV